MEGPSSLELDGKFTTHGVSGVLRGAFTADVEALE